MIISFLGDSITEGCGASEHSNCYVEVLGKQFGIETKNYGIGGTRIAKQKSLSFPHIWDMNFVSRLNFIDKKSDFVFAFGGTNDYGHGDADFGTEKDKTEDTFCGAVRVLVKKLIKRFGKDKICIILPCRRFGDENENLHGKTLRDYVDAIRKTAIKNGIDYIDLYNNGFSLPKTDTGDEYTSDGLHPNDNGHAYLAGIIAKYLAGKKLI